MRTIQIVMLVGVFLLLSVQGVSQNHVVHTRITMSAQAYMDQYAHWLVLQSNEGEFALPAGSLRLSHHFPDMTIFDAAGKMLYFSEDCDSNVRVLERLPTLPNQKNLPKGKMSESGVLDLSADTRALKNQIRKSGRPLIVSIASPLPEAIKSSQQIDAIISMLKGKRAENINIIEVMLIR